MLITRVACCAASVAVVVALSACGGGGGGGGGGGASSPGPVIGAAADYWAADPNSVWLFNGRDNTQNTTYRNRITMGPSQVLGGRTLARFNDTLPFNDPSSVGSQYRSLDSDGIRIYLEDSPTSIDASYLELPAQIRQGSYLAFERIDAFPGGTETFQIHVDIIGFETLVLPAGTFVDALKTRHRFTVTAQDDEGNALGTAVLNLNFWYAKSVGPVKVTLDDPSAMPATDTVEELAGFIVPGIKAGVVGEFLLLDDLDSGSSALTTGRPGVASDGTGYLIAARRFDGSNAQIVATYLDSNGRAVWSKTVIDESGVTPLDGWYEHPVSVAFDGTNFWIVAKTSSLYSYTNILRQRVSPAGVLADPAGGVLIANGAWPVLASRPGSVLLVHVASAGSPTWESVLYATLFLADGTVARSEQEIARFGNASNGAAAVAVNGDRYLVTFEVADAYLLSRDLKAVRIDSTGSLLDSTPIEVSSAGEDQESSAVAPWGGTDFVSLWQDSRNYGFQNADIFGARISAGGLLLDDPAATGGVELNHEAEYRDGTAAATGVRGTLLAYTVGSYASLTTAPSGIFARVFEPNAEFSVSNPTSDGVLVGLVTNHDTSVLLMAPAAAANSESHLVVWVYNSSGTISKSVRGALVFPLYMSP